jgi:hypothetical protein
MICVFLGGGMGSWLGARAYARFGWLGECVLVALLCALALARHIFHLRRTTGGPADAGDARAGAPGRAGG